MTALQLVISPAAHDDLRDIFLFGLHRWGPLQSSRYIEQINDRLWLLLSQPLIGVARAQLFPGIRSLEVESHTVFYQIRDTRIEIVRVLHARQDPHRHILQHPNP